MPNLDEQIEDLLKTEAQDESQEVKEEEKQDEEADKVEEEKPEDKPKVEAVEKEESISPAQLRWQISEMKRELAALKSQPKEAPKPVSEDPEPNKSEKYEEWLEWRDRQIEKKASSLEERLGKFEQNQEQTRAQQVRQQAYDAAFGEIERLASDLATKIPDYEEVQQAITRQFVAEIRARNPMATNDQIMSAYKQKLVELGKTFYDQGINPAQGLYNYGKSFYVPQPKTETKVEVESKPNLKTIAKNQKKSASGLGSGTSGRPALTPDAIKDMSIAQLESLTAEEMEAVGIRH